METSGYDVTLSECASCDVMANSTPVPIENDSATCTGQAQTESAYQLYIDIIMSVLLIIFVVLVIGGNLLIIISVLTCRKLRTITNTYIVSLAFADLLLGLLVLPFSGTLEVLRYWPFGSQWCKMWLAVDVLLCTASILNLCVISFDRYLAISRPFRYQTIMSHWKAKFLVGIVWLVSFIVCAPPLIEALLKESTNQEPDATSAPPNIIERLNTSYQRSYVSYNSTNVVLSFDNNNKDKKLRDKRSDQSDECTLTSGQGYVIYSAVCSFWIPVWIMAFFYWRIYTIAARTTRGVRRGVLHTRSGGNSSTAENTVTLRIHRGGSCQRHASVRSTISSRSESQSEALVSPFGSRKNSAISLRSFKRENSLRDSNMYRQIRSNSTVECASVSNATRPSVKIPKVKVTFSNSDNNNSFKMRSNTSPSRTSPSRTASSPNGLLAHSIIEEEETSFTDIGQSNDGLHRHNGMSSHNDSVLNRIGNRFNFVNRLKYYNREKKAAKTVGIIVGCFVLCWAPFFTVYLLSAFCSKCTPDIVFKIFFWLGYCNSAINPCVYALFSKDFRFAFKKLLCCRCERQQPTFKERRKSRFRSFLNSFKIQISSRSSDDTQYE